MRAVKGRAGDVEVVDIDEPNGSGVLVRVVAVTICGSDLNYLKRGSEQFIGHEISGVTDDGTPVIMEGVFGCRACRWCDRGMRHLCARTGREILGMTVAGGMAEYFRVPAESLIPVPAGLDVRDAALAEPGAVAWHAVANAGVDAASRVAVVGGGAIGILAVLAARRQGAAEVALLARHPHQIELGERYGAGAPTADYDVVIEASGSESGLARAFELARPRGVVSSVSVYPPDISWPYRAAFLKEVSMMPSIGFAQHSDGQPEIAHVASMLASDPTIAESLITHRFGIDEAVRAFEVAREKSAGALRVAVHP
ncbi:MAG: zinc-binding dehydrogenase [Microbacterium sp.]